MSTGHDIVRRSAGGCPICGKPPAPATRPFCSTRCADVDLHRWLGGVYRVETDEQPEGGNVIPLKQDR